MTRRPLLLLPLLLFIATGCGPTGWRVTTSIEYTVQTPTSPAVQEPLR